MKINKEWDERYNYDLMIQQFKIEFENNLNFNIDGHIKELLSLKKDEIRAISFSESMGYDAEDEDFELFNYYGRIIRYWKRFKKEIESSDR